MSETVSKARVWLLALVAAALVIDGSAPISEAPASSADASPALDAPAVALLLSGVNPSLSEPELQRIGTAVIRYSGKYGLDADLVTAVLLVEKAAAAAAGMGLLLVSSLFFEPGQGALTEILVWLALILFSVAVASLWLLLRDDATGVRILIRWARSVLLRLRLRFLEQSPDNDCLGHIGC